MREQLEQRITTLNAVLRQRDGTVSDCEAALRDARTNRDRVAGGIVELEYALEQADVQPPDDDKIKGKIPAVGN